MTKAVETRLPTTQELINAMVRILIAYHLLIENKQKVKEWDEHTPEILKGLIAMAYSIPIASIVESDQLLSQRKEEVYLMLAKLINNKPPDLPSVASSKEVK